MKTIQSITFLFMVLAMSYLILQVNCSSFGVHGKQAKEDELHDEKRATVYGDESLCGNGKPCKRAVGENKGAHINEVKRTSVVADSGTCFRGQLCKRFAHESKGDLTLNKENKRASILSDTVKCGHGRLCKRVVSENVAVLPEHKERDSIIAAPDCKDKACRKKRDSIVAAPDCKNHACKK